MYLILPVVVVVVVVVIGKGSLDIREMYRRKRRMKGG